MNKIVPAYKHGKFGTFMFNWCAAWTVFLVKHRWLYYVLACTWGIIMTIFGIIVTIFCAIYKLFNKKVTFRKFRWIYSVSIGPDYWGGFETGLMFVRDQDSWDELDYHEFGHTFQNCLFGPITIFMVFIPSMTRYWYQEIRTRHGKTNKPYDGIWFEDAASRCGEYANNYILAKANKSHKTK